MDLPHRLVTNKPVHDHRLVTEHTYHICPLSPNLFTSVVRDSTALYFRPYLPRLFSATMTEYIYNPDAYEKCVACITLALLYRSFDRADILPT
jgi:hypothetical protein